MSTIQPLSDSESKLLEQYRAEHPKQLPWQFSLKWLMLLTTCVALLAALVARTNMAVGFLLLLAFGTAVTARRLSRQRKQVMREIDEKLESGNKTEEAITDKLEQSHDPVIRNLLASFSNENITNSLYAAWLGTVAAGTLYAPLIVSLSILVEGKPLRLLSSAACSAVAGFLVSSFLGAVVMVAVGLFLKLTGFRGHGFAIGSLVGGGTGLVALGLLFFASTHGSRGHYLATALAVVLGQIGGVWAVRKQALQKTHRIFKPKRISQPRRFRLRQLFMLTTVVAVLSALLSQLGLSEAQVTVCLAGSAWLGVTILVELLYRAQRSNV